MINPDEKLRYEILQKIRANDGHCISKSEISDATLCPCEEFLNKKEIGQCDCGLYIKTEV